MVRGGQQLRRERDLVERVFEAAPIGLGVLSRDGLERFPDRAPEFYGRRPSILTATSSARHRVYDADRRSVPPEVRPGVRRRPAGRGLGMPARGGRRPAPTPLRRRCSLHEGSGYQTVPVNDVVPSDGLTVVPAGVLSDSIGRFYSERAGSAQHWSNRLSTLDWAIRLLQRSGLREDRAEVVRPYGCGEIRGHSR